MQRMYQDGRADLGVWTVVLSSQRACFKRATCAENGRCSHSQSTQQSEQRIGYASWQW